MKHLKLDPAAYRGSSPSGLETFEARCLLSGLPTGSPFLADQEAIRPAGPTIIHEPISLERVWSTEGKASNADASGPITRGSTSIATQPVGALSGKIVYTHAGHGYTANNLTNGAWSFQRPETFELIEDLSNQDQMTFFVDHLYRAGATVVPLRPVGHQVNEVVMDNTDPGVSFVGAWSDSSSPIYYGAVGDTPYRFASASGSAGSTTAYARYRPDIPEAGLYPVYVWTRYGSDRVNQAYRINHTGGTTEVRIDHRMVGNGLVYLGTFAFEAGDGNTSGYVDIVNDSNESGVVIADMIRFGNGMGDIDRGGGISGLPREDEAGLYWMQWHVDRAQGVSSSTYRASSNDNSATVSASPRYAAYMNREASGLLSDRVFVSYHSNAGTGSSRGVLGLYNGNNTPSSATPNQFLLADTLARELNDDLVVLDADYEHPWQNRTVVTLDRSDIEFGEINNAYINDEFDATIIEYAFHDNQLDAELVRDANVRDDVARATTQGLVRYFAELARGNPPINLAPDPVTLLGANLSGDGTSATVQWSGAVSDLGVGGDPATEYLVQTSRDGLGFDGGVVVSGLPTVGTFSHTIAGLDPADGALHLRVTALNLGGASAATDVLSVLPVAAGSLFDATKVLIVNGFDRLDRSLNPNQTIGSATIDRVRPRQSNARDYPVRVAEAIEASAPGVAVDSASNESITSGLFSLSDYDAVVWILGEESSVDDTFDGIEQLAVNSYLNNGGKLFVSGAEIGWDLDQLNNGRTFYNDTLRADYVADDANTYDVSGISGGILDGLSFSFDDGSTDYDAQFPDVITTSNGSTLIASYGATGTAGGAGVAWNEQLVMFGFPYETIVGEASRTAVMARVLDYLGIEADAPDPAPLATVSLVLDNDDGPSVYNETGVWALSGSAGYNGGTYRFANAGDAATASWNWDSPGWGLFEVEVQYRSGTNRSPAVAYDISADPTPQLGLANQTLNNLTWVSLGSYALNAGSNAVTLNALPSITPGVVIADAVRVTGTAVTADRGDVNNDGLINDADIDLLSQWLADPGAAPAESMFLGDLDRDGLVTSTDRTTLITSILSTNFGDANLDGSVGLLDLDLLGANWQANPAGWGMGDFNGDGMVSLLDLDLLGANWGASAARSTMAASSSVGLTNDPGPAWRFPEGQRNGSAGSLTSGLTLSDANDLDEDSSGVRSFL